MSEHPIVMSPSRESVLDSVELLVYQQCGSEAYTAVRDLRAERDRYRKALERIAATGTRPGWHAEPLAASDIAREALEAKP